MFWKIRLWWLLGQGFGLTARVLQVWVLGFPALSPPLTPVDPLEARCK